MRIFLDANILFSAAKSDGAIRELLRLLNDAGHELWADAYVVEEAKRNLELKGGAVALEAELERIHVAPFRMRELPDVGLPEKDAPVLASAVANRCEALVTGDRKHFGAFYGQTVQGVAIHSPQSVFEALFG